jgi:hypothetical protein
MEWRFTQDTDYRTAALQLVQRKRTGTGVMRATRGLAF